MHGLHCHLTARRFATVTKSVAKHRAPGSASQCIFSGILCTVSAGKLLLWFVVMPSVSERSVILVVDDDEVLRESLHLILDDHYEVVDAGDGHAALTVLKQRHIDLVLLDLLLPDLDGFEVLEEIGALPVPVPVVVISAINSAWTAAAAMRLGTVDYVTKPFEKVALLEVVSTSIRGLRAPKPPRGSRSQAATILVIGLDLGMRATLSLILAAACQVQTVGLVSHALARLKDSRPDIVVLGLSDEMLRLHPDPVRRVRVASPHTPVIAIDATRRSVPPRSLPDLPLVVTLNQAASLVDLLNEISSLLPRSRGSLPQFSELTSRIVDYLARHFSDVTIEQLGHAVGMSAYYLSHRFSREMGLLLRTYLSLLRVEVAKSLLAETDDNLDVIASRVGLHDASHLSRLFLSHTGKRPGVYRRSERGA